MEKMIKKNNESILENDVVLIYIDNNPSFFARIENITADVKKGWWRVRLLILQIPLMVTTWILDNEQIQGVDFTMGGTPIRIEKVIAPTILPETNFSEKKETEIKTTSKKQASIISLKPDVDNNPN
jgi:hypothetical protein